MGYQGFPDAQGPFKARARAGRGENVHMQILIERVAMLVIHGVPPDGRLDVPEGITAGQLLPLLHLRPEHQRVVTVFVNETRVRPSAVLKEGDRVFLGLPMSGG